MDKDQDPTLRPPTMPMTAAHGETAGSGQQASMMQADEVPLDLGSSFQLQAPAGTDMHGAGLAFNWDQSLDMIPGGLGWVFTSDLG